VLVPLLNTGAYFVASSVAPLGSNIIPIHVAVNGERRHMELEPDGIGGEDPAGQPCPFDRAFALFT
jgi:hypothetical protein